MFSLSTILLFVFNTAAGADTDSLVAQTNEAATLLSRFEPGTLPSNTSVLAALAHLSEAGTSEHLPLLKSLAHEERPSIRRNADAVIAAIGARQRTATRSNFSAPRHDEVAEWLLRHEPIGPAGEPLGRNEKVSVAYSAIVLDGHIGPYLMNWKEVGYRFEQDGQYRNAIQIYTTAVLHGQSGAFHELTQFPLNAEILMLGVFTALPHDHPARAHLMDWLVEHGAIATVRVMAERAKRASALDRAVAIEALAVMIREGKLKPNAANIARTRLERSTRDPHKDVSVFARATLDELTSSR